MLKQKPHGYNAGGIFADKSPTVTANSGEHNNHIIKLANTQPGGKGQSGYIYDINAKAATLTTGTWKGTLIRKPGRIRASATKELTTNFEARDGSNGEWSL